MKTCETRVRITTKAMRLLSLAAACLIAHGAYAATWTGANGTDLADPDNWADGDIATTPMLFGMDASTTLSQDLTVYGIFKSGESGQSYRNRTVEFNLGGHTLTSLNAGEWRHDNTTYRFTNGNLLNVNGSTTNAITVSNNNYPRAFFEVTGTETTFVGNWKSRAMQSSGFGPCFRVLDGASAYGADFFFGGRYSTNEVSDASSLNASTSIIVGGFGSGTSSYSYNTGHCYDVLAVSGASTLAGGSLCVGHGFNSSSAGNHDNRLTVSGGSTASVSALYLGTYGPNYSNTVEIAGEGTAFTVSGAAYLGNDSATSERTGTPYDNSLVVSDGATATINGIVYIGSGGTNNSLFVRSGARLSASHTHNYLGGDKRAGVKSHLFAEGSGTEVSFVNSLYVRNLTEDAGMAQTITVMDGATLSASKIALSGAGNKVMISNATVSVSGNLWTIRETASGTDSSNTVFRFSGDAPALSCNRFNDTTRSLLGAPVLEYVIPEAGWSVAPLRSNESFTIPADVVLRIDADSVKAYKSALAARGEKTGIVPLMKTGATNWAITIEDETALAANLPEGCSLVYEDGVLSVKIKSGSGLAIFVR